MDVREKLVEIIQNSVGGCARHWAEVIADGLIAHGVTVQEWISVKDELPPNDYGKHWQERRQYLVILENGTMRVARYGYKEYDWWIGSQDVVLHEKHYTGVARWMPLPEPPKGE